MTDWTVKATLSHLETTGTHEQRKCVRVLRRLLEAYAQALADVRTLDDYQKADGRPYVSVPAPFLFENGEWGHKFAPGRYTSADEARAKAAEWVRKQTATASEGR